MFWYRAFGRLWNMDTFAAEIKLESSTPLDLIQLMSVSNQCKSPHICMPIHIPILCRKTPLGPISMVIPMQSYENYLQNHLIGTDISVKLGIVPICIRIGITTGSVETVLHIIILDIWTKIRIGIGIGIGVRQWKHTIRVQSHCAKAILLKK